MAGSGRCSVEREGGGGDSDARRSALLSLRSWHPVCVCFVYVYVRIIHKVTTDAIPGRRGGAKSNQGEEGGVSGNKPTKAKRS
jgi:hypothetical protein